MYFLMNLIQFDLTQPVENAKKSFKFKVQKAISKKYTLSKTQECSASMVVTLPRNLGLFGVPLSIECARKRNKRKQQRATFDVRHVDFLCFRLFGEAKNLIYRQALLDERIFIANIGFASS
jgi:hypothetical protein